MPGGLGGAGGEVGGHVGREVGCFILGFNDCQWMWMDLLYAVPHIFRKHVFSEDVKNKYSHNDNTHFLTEKGKDNL